MRELAYCKIELKKSTKILKRQLVGKCNRETRKKKRLRIPRIHLIGISQRVNWDNLEEIIYEEVMVDIFPIQMKCEFSDSGS